MNGKAEGRWLGNSPCDNERTIALRKNALRAYEGKSSALIPPGPWSRIGTDSHPPASIVLDDRVGARSRMPMTKIHIIARYGVRVVYSKAGGVGWSTYFTPPLSTP